MIEPRDLLTWAQPPIYPKPGLHKRYGVYAMAYGVWSPRILVDRNYEGQPGWEAMMFHEGLHVHERHALCGLVLLLIPVVGWIAWFLWRREQEIRADAFALKGSGPSETWAFIRQLHPHPTDWFGRWCYGRTAKDRWERTVARAWRYGWLDDPKT